MRSLRQADPLHFMVCMRLVYSEEEEEEQKEEEELQLLQEEEDILQQVDPPSHPAIVPALSGTPKPP